MRLRFRAGKFFDRQPYGLDQRPRRLGDREIQGRDPEPGPLAATRAAGHSLLLMPHDSMDPSPTLTD